MPPLSLCTYCYSKNSTKRNSREKVLQPEARSTIQMKVRLTIKNQKVSKVDIVSGEGTR